MDKRTLLFIVGLSVLFFFVHQWFDNSTGQPVPPSTPSTQVEIVETKSPTKIDEADFNKYQIVKVYKDVALTQFASFGFQEGENVVLFAWQKDLPRELFVKSVGERVALTNRLILHVKPKKTGDPVLYSIYSIANYKVPFIPYVGTYPVTLIYFENENAYKFSGKTVGTEQLILDHKPPQNAFVLLDYQGKMAPYGVYSLDENKILYFDHLPQFEDASTLTFPEAEKLEKDFHEQEYYVLENEYQQLVFTNLNGAIAEINLPFTSGNNPNSVVRPTEFDRIMESQYAFNDSFPQFSYQVPGGKKSEKMNPVKGGYYPLLRRNLIGRSGGAPSTKINPHYYAYTVFDEDQTPVAEIYQLKRFEKGLIEFELVQGNRRIIKTFTLPKNPAQAPYCVDLTIRVEGDARGLQLSTGVPEVELISGSFSPAIKYQITRNQKQKVEEISVPKELVSFNHIQPDWVCDGNGFFGIISTPLGKSSTGFSVIPVSGELAPTRLSVIDAQYSRFPTADYPGYNIHIPLSAKSGLSQFRIFAGPFDKNILERVDQTYSDPQTGYNPNYAAAQSYHGWFAFISQPFAKFLFILMSFFYKVTHSWGISIILLTLALRIMLYPLNSWSLKSTVKMQQIAPKVTALQEKYKKDKKRAQLEIMTLYRKEGVNPFGGCLPLLIQLPFLFGMFDLLKTSFDLRGASFIPGWIDDLTAPDDLFSWKYPIFFIGNSFHLLPILLGVIMYYQQKFTSASKITGPMTDQQKQQKTMGNIMTLVFTVLFYHFQSGLNIYWISSMLLSMLQQWWISKRTALKNPQVEKKT